MTLPILFLFLLVLPNHYEALSVNHHHTWSVQSILRDLRSSFTPAPPPHTQPAKLARYIVHFSGNQFSFQSPLYTLLSLLINFLMQIGLQWLQYPLENQHEACPLVTPGASVMGLRWKYPPELLIFTSLTWKCPSMIYT